MSYFSYLRSNSGVTCEAAVRKQHFVVYLFFLFASWIIYIPYMPRLPLYACTTILLSLLSAQYVLISDAWTLSCEFGNDFCKTNAANTKYLMISIY